MPANVTVDREKIAEFCRRRHIRKLSLFGSVLTSDFGPDSDVDVLVEFGEGARTGFAFMDMEEELARLLGVPRVDLVNRKYLNRWLERQILASARVQYEEG
jgi:hypothetical protein